MAMKIYLLLENQRDDIVSSLRGAEWRHDHIRVIDLKTGGKETYPETILQIIRADAGKKPDEETDLLTRTVCITDVPQLSCLLDREGICCIGIESGEASVSDAAFFLGAYAVLQDPNDLDRKWMEQQCCHYHRVPCTIFQNESVKIRESIPEDYECLKAMLVSPEYHADGFAFSGGEEENRVLFEEYTRSAYRIWGFGMWTVQVRPERFRWEDASDRSTWITAGWCGLFPGTDAAEESRPEMGYVIREGLRGRGIGFQAGCEILRYAAKELEMETVMLRIRKDNTASLQLAERLRSMTERELPGFQLKIIVITGAENRTLYYKGAEVTKTVE